MDLQRKRNAIIISRAITSSNSERWLRGWESSATFREATLTIKATMRRKLRRQRRHCRPCTMMMDYLWRNRTGEMSRRRRRLCDEGVWARSRTEAHAPNDHQHRTLPTWVAVHENDWWIGSTWCARGGRGFNQYEWYAFPSYYRLHLALGWPTAMPIR